MFRAGLSIVVLTGLAVASFGAHAQDVSNATLGGPLDLRPAQAKAESAPKPKPKAKAKPKAKPVAVAKPPEAATVERATVIAPAPVKAPAVSDKPIEKAVAPEAPKAPADVRPPFDEYVISQYCQSLSSAASDGRLAWQAKRLEEMEGRLRDRIGELEAKRAETADWLKRREEALRKAEETVVAIYSKMKPEAAAAQFSAMDESGAAAILGKLNPRMASTVLNEIDASRAARIAAEMAGVGPRRETARVTP